MNVKLGTLPVLLGILTTVSGFAADPLDLGPFGIGGCHTRSRTAQDSATWIPQMQEIGLRFIRTGMTAWEAVQPAPDRFDFTKLDEQLAYFEQHGFSSGALVNGNASWNPLDKGSVLPVHNLPAWSKYVSELARHTRGRVKRFEVWNEPPNGTGKDQTPADYAQVIVAAYDAAKAVDPTNTIGLAAKSADLNYLDLALQAGAKDHFDWITLHPYEILGSITDLAGTEAVYMNIVPSVRKMLAVRNPEKMQAPIVFTEIGCDAGSKGPERQAWTLIKAYTMGIAQGVACIDWFEGRDGDSGPIGLIDAKGEKRPAYFALAQMIKHLGQHPQYLGWLTLSGKHYGFAFQGAQGPVLIAWSYRKNTGEIAFTKPLPVVNLLTGQVTALDKAPLSPEPIMVLNPPEELLQKARANVGKPLDWGGDFTKAKSVSIAWSEHKTIESGLHSLDGESVAQDVVAYGGSARAGGVPSGNLFVVDPGFLSYTTTPIEITVVVRRNEANDNAGFNLIYESTTGLKAARGGWYTVPDNKEWHTVKFQIDDPQFVNYWGYNFSFNSDGPKLSKYYLQSVTVTKK